MKHLLYISFVILSINNLFAGTPQSGTWQGVAVRAGQPVAKGTLLFVDFNLSEGLVSGKTREEVFNTDLFAVKQIKGTYNDAKISFQQIVVQKSSKSSRTKWCRYKCELTYDSLSGFMKGTYTSSDCRRVQGKIILYKSNFDLTDNKEPLQNHHWFEVFINDQTEGLNAPEIRKIERDNFVFTPVFFDYDKSIIRSEHHDFLNRMIKIIKGHSDLRVKIIGHTDSDGSNKYNDDLSKRRAQSIIDYFVSKGLKANRLEFDFKGENSPIDTNSTKEGKQRNRRVDFSFI